MSNELGNNHLEFGEGYRTGFVQGYFHCLKKFKDAMFSWEALPNNDINHSWATQFHIQVKDEDEEIS